MWFFVAVSLGVTTWSFLEYWIHRYLGHMNHHNVFATEHLRHHAEGDYFAPAWKKVVAAIVVFSFLGALGGLIAGWGLGLSYATGFVAAWLGYEWIHHDAHFHAGRTAYGRWVRRHHFGHHFHHPASCHGVTSPIWDVVFGTYMPLPEMITVPDRLAMVWLIGQDGEVLGAHRSHWQLRRRRKAA
jgi:sterol desaturase/sphingolipid hydroxylase (fatty acid hydroxylase superfamily)